MSEPWISLMHLMTVPVGFIALTAAASYIVLAAVASLAWRMRRRPSSPQSRRPVTILKPLCGAEPGLYENLRTFCDQRYPEFEIVFGVRDPADPACQVVERLMAEFPSLPIKLVRDSKLHGSNRKVSNLINMLPHANHELLVMADSDAYAGTNYLSTVTAPLHDAEVGLVTCVFRAVPAASIWSRVGAMYINEWYMPLVLISWLFGYQNYVSGQTLCMRQSTLRAIGGLQVLADRLAEDNRLGQLVRGLRLRIELSPLMLDAEHYEPDLRSMVRHELRWMRTLRALRPRAFLSIFLTFSMPLALLGIALASTGPTISPAAWGLFVGCLAARIILHVAPRLSDARPILSDLWLLPLRDVLLCWIWCRSWFTSRITWRNGEFAVDADGVMRPVS